MGAMACDTSLAHGIMFINKRTGLIAMTLRACFILARHRQSSSRFQDVGAMRIMALHAIQAAFKDWMVIWKMKLGLDIRVTLKTGLRIFCRINNEFSPPSPGLNMSAARAVAGFAAG